MSDLRLPQTAPKTPLERSDLEEINEALVYAYSIPDLDRRLGFKWGVRIEREVGTDGGSRSTFARLVNWAEEAGRTRDLLALAWTGKPGNDRLLAAAQRLLPDMNGAQALYDPMLANALSTPVQGELEALITERSRRVDYQEFMRRLERLGEAICKIEIPGGGSGTGFLVGRRHILTNHHVVQQAVDNRPLGAEIICRFDYQNAPNGGTAAGRPLKLADDWLVKFSEHSPSDVTGSGAPLPDELDFALLCLAEQVSAERESFGLSTKTIVVAPGDVALIAQHPGGDPLSIAYGVVNEFPANGLRYRYNITTGPGSSGSPVLSADLELIGLHHAAEPTTAPKYNQCVPIFLVARALGDDAELAAM